MLQPEVNRSRDSNNVRLARHSSERHLCRVAALAAWGTLSFSLFLAGSPGAGGDDSKTQERDQRSRHRREFMQSVINDLEISSKDIRGDSALKLGGTPLLRYNDPTRSLGEATTGLLDGGVWRLGETGRPTALVTLEIYRVQKDRAILSYEFVSLVPSELAIASPRGPSWNPAGTELKMARLPEAGRPADSAKARLAQMRQASRRYSVHETLEKGDKVECRLLPQPIDRYSDEERHIADGAMFVFANGTNPELGLLLECDADEWSYGLVRLSAAALSADLDGKQCFEALQRFGQPRTAPYLGTTHPITLDE
jgi:hypothetical protein